MLVWLCADDTATIDVTNIFCADSLNAEDGSTKQKLN